MRPFVKLLWTLCSVLISNVARATLHFSPQIKPLSLLDYALVSRGGVQYLWPHPWCWSWTLKPSLHHCWNGELEPTCCYAVTEHHDWRWRCEWRGWLSQPNSYLGSIDYVVAKVSTLWRCADRAGARRDVIEWRACTASWTSRRWAACRGWASRSASCRRAARRTSARWPAPTRSVETVVAAAACRSASAVRGTAYGRSPRERTVTSPAGSRRAPRRTDHTHLQTHKYDVENRREADPQSSSSSLFTHNSNGNTHTHTQLTNERTGRLLLCIHHSGRKTTTREKMPKKQI